MRTKVQTRRSVVQGPNRYLAATWRLLTEPPTVIEEPERRRRARLLSALLAALIPLSIFGVASSTLASPPDDFLRSTFTLAVTMIFVLIIVYALSRTAYYTLAASLTVGLLTIATLVASTGGGLEDLPLAIYLSLCVLLSSMLLPVQGTALVSLASLAGLLVMPTISPHVTPSYPGYVDTLSFNMIMFITILVAAAIRHRDLMQIEQQSATVSELYREAERHARETTRVNNRLEAILDSVGDALMVIGLDGTIEQVNSAFEEQCGYTAFEAINRHQEDLNLQKLMSRETLRDANKAMAHERVWRGETVIQRKDGTTYDAAVTLAPVRSFAGKVISFVASIRDISALKEVERMKDAFVSNVSHELRTPIASLKVNLSLLAKSPPHKYQSLLKTLQRETNRLHLIIEDLLRLSRLEQYKLELALSTTDLNALVEQYANDRVALAESQGLKLSIDCQPNLPGIQADFGLLGQILSALMTNAFNYTPAGGQVVVRTQIRDDDDQQWVGFSVSDTGPGIPLEERGHLFQRFFRGKVGRESSMAGTGLGLAIAKQIVDRHAGEIELENDIKPGQGATFTVWLPVAQ